MIKLKKERKCMARRRRECWLLKMCRFYIICLNIYHVRYLVQCWNLFMLALAIRWLSFLSFCLSSFSSFELYTTSNENCIAPAKRNRRCYYCAALMSYSNNVDLLVVCFYSPSKYLLVRITVPRLCVLMQCVRAAALAPIHSCKYWMAFIKLGRNETFLLVQV